VFIHPSSALFHSSPPDFIVFTELVRTSRVWIKGITKVNGAWLAELGKSMCSFSRPMEVPSTGKGRSGPSATGGSGGGASGNERDVVVIPHFGALGVDLPAVKKKQRREGTRWVLVE
jgi:ATP-dependent RNA helicase DHX37/DHR1